MKLGGHLVRLAATVQCDRIANIVHDHLAGVAAGQVLFEFVAHGRIGHGPEATLVDRYLKRISWPVQLTELSDSGTGKPGELITPAVTIVLDERGQALTSRALATRLETWRDTGMREARFIIGPADGHAPAVTASATLMR